MHAGNGFDDDDDGAVDIVPVGEVVGAPCVTSPPPQAENAAGRAMAASMGTSGPVRRMARTLSSTGPRTLRYAACVPELSLIRASAITLTTHLVFGVVSLFIGAIAIKAIDHFLLRKIDLEEEIARGNLAAAVYAAGLWIALAMILTRIG